jgi:hypothetical protein
MFNGVWHRILHDQTAESLAREISRLPHANVTTVPFHFDDRAPALIPKRSVMSTNGNGHSNGKVPVSVLAPAAVRADGSTPIASVQWRQRVTLTGRIQAQRVQPLAGSPSLECTLADETGVISVVFLGRREIAGVTIGRTVRVEGRAVDHHGRLAILNPSYELLPK